MSKAPVAWTLAMLPSTSGYTGSWFVPSTTHRLREGPRARQRAGGRATLQGQLRAARLAGGDRRRGNGGGARGGGGAGAPAVLLVDVVQGQPGAEQRVRVGRDVLRVLVPALAAGRRRGALRLHLGSGRVVGLYNRPST
jgi:hypothetical protein